MILEAPKGKTVATFHNNDLLGRAAIDNNEKRYNSLI